MINPKVKIRKLSQNRLFIASSKNRGWLTIRYPTSNYIDSLFMMFYRDRQRSRANTARLFFFLLFFSNIIALAHSCEWHRIISRWQEKCRYRVQKLKLVSAICGGRRNAVFSLSRSYAQK